MEPTRSNIEAWLQPRGECWEWTRARTKAGYGVFRHQQKYLYVHRVMYELVTGTSADGFEVCHHCDNPACARPSHLFLGSHADNMADRAVKGRAKPGEQHPHAKLTWAAVRDIRASVAAGATQVSMCRKYGIGAPQVCEIVQGRAWKEPA